MVRLFKTCFYFSGQTYLATVSIMEYKNLKTISLFLPDKSLHSILPYGQLTFEEGEGVKISERGLKKAEALIYAVLSAIETCNLSDIPKKKFPFPPPPSFQVEVPAVLQFFVNGQLKDSLNLPADFGEVDEKEEKWHLQNAMARLLDKWKGLDEQGTSPLEFKLVWLRKEKGTT